LEAARRRREHGPISRQWCDRAIKRACSVVKRSEDRACPCGEKHEGEAGIPSFSAGASRHSIATLAVNSGADPAQVAAYLHHKSPAITRKFYATHASAAKVPTFT
jgi:integrase